MPTNTFREGSFGGLSRLCRVSNDLKRNVRNSATTVSISRLISFNDIEYSSISSWRTAVES
jgi:hypothetical protein